MSDGGRDLTTMEMRAQRSGLYKTLAALALAAGIAACSGSPQISGSGEQSGGNLKPGAGSQAPAAVRPTAQSAREVNALFNKYSVPEQDGTAADYRLAPMDVVDVAVYDAANLSRAAQIGASGDITLPLIGNVKAAGRTTEQLQADIALKLRQKYMQSPQVFVAVKEYNSQRVTVDGAVKNPGVIPLKGKTTLVEVIASAGGLNEMGSPSGVFILRKVDGKKMAARFDLNEIRKGKKEDPVMRAGDIVMVDESGGKVALKGLQTAMGFTGIFSMLLL